MNWGTFDKSTSSKIFKVLLTIALLAMVCFFAGCNKDANANKNSIVSVMIYSEYTNPEMLADFSEKTGFEVKIDLYESQEEMVSRLQIVGTEKYDVIVASDVVIQQLIHLGLIQPLDTSKIPNHVNIADQFKNSSYDHTNRYSVPYLWGTTGILYRDTSVDPMKVSYDMLFDAKQTKGGFSLLEERRSMLSMALQAKGFDANSTNRRQISSAVEHIIKAKQDPHFTGFVGSVEGKNRVLSKQDWAAVVFNGEAMRAIAEDSSLQYAIPVEGSFMWVDAMLLSARAPNKEGAYAFMNYILDGKVGAQLAKHVNFATPNKESLKYLDDSFKSNRVINPSGEELKRLTILKDPGSTVRIFDEAWNTVKAR